MAGDAAPNNTSRVSSQDCLTYCHEKLAGPDLCSGQIIYKQGITNSTTGISYLLQLACSVPLLHHSFSLNKIFIIIPAGAPRL